MNQSKLFRLTRLRLTGCYVGVMAVILSLCGVLFYEVMVQAHWHALHQELEAVAGTLHDGLEPNLKQPGQIEPTVQAIIPGLCLADGLCPTTAQHRHILGAVQQAGYYARFLTQSGELVATVGQQPDELPFVGGNELWQTLQDRQGHRYHHISLLLKTASHQPWGYLQVGRSLYDLDADLATIRWVLGLGLPLTLVLITGASWWLAGLAMRPVYQSYRQVQQFTTDAAHELRTPLAATQATIEAALEAEPLSPSDARSTLQTLERQNHRLIQLVQDLLLLSRMDWQVLPLKQQSVKLNRLLADVVDEFEALAIAAHLTLQLEILAPDSVMVCGDEEQLYRLVANLVTNAIQYTPKEGQIILRLKSTLEQAIIQVQDNGIGIPEAAQAHIFDRFYRVNSDRSRHTGGAGLGLAIAAAIAQTHRGHLAVQSQPSAGSTFTVCLPLK